jgi:drug/metabolite transporter (DMT)-like permease
MIRPTSPADWNYILSTKATPYVLLLGILFGTTLVISRFSVDQFEPTTYIGLRLALSCLGLALAYGLHVGKRRWPRDRQLWRHAAVLGVLGTAIPMTGIVTALLYISSGLASILITVNPAITVLLAHFFLIEESLTWRKALGVLLALGGAVLLAAMGETGLVDVKSGNPIGYWMIFGAMISSSIAIVYARKYMQNLDTFDVTGVRLFVAALVVIPLSVSFIGFDVSRVDLQGVLALVYAAIAGTFVGMLLSFYNIQRFGAIAAVMSAYVTPMVASLTGVLLLGEQITFSMLGGMTLIGLGVWQINRN